MAISVTLFPNYILATASSSTLGIEAQSPNGSYCNFGTVTQVADGVTAPTVGQSIMFDVRTAIQIKYGSTIYFLVSADKVFFNEEEV